MKKTAMLLCLVLVFGILTGCSPQPEAYVPTGNGLADATQSVDESTPQAPGALDQQPEDYAFAYYEAEGFNPYLCTSFNNRMLLPLVYQGLFAMNQNYEAEPILCKSYTVSENLRTYTFRLESAMFSDGTMLTAEDVVASLLYAAESDMYRGRFDFISDIYAVDERTVTVVTAISYENLPMLLTVPIVKKATIEAPIPIGSGPYSVITTASGLAMQKNARWWCSADLPVTADTIPLRAFESPADIRDGFEFENIGISTSDPGSASYAEYRCDYELWEEETGIFLYLGCNANSEVFSNDEVRRALTYAIDRHGLLEEIYNGFGAVATLPASPNSPFYHKGLASQITYDPERLEQALIKAGMRGKEIVLYVNKSDSIRLQAARRIAGMLTDCGLVVVLEDNSTDYYRDGLLAGNYDLYLGQTKLTSTMDLSEFYAPYGALSFGGMEDPACYSMAMEALENSGNYYNLHKLCLENGQLVPILFRTYAIYGKRGLMNSLAPARDNVFYYSLGKSIPEIMSIAYEDE